MNYIRSNEDPSIQKHLLISMFISFLQRENKSPRLVSLICLEFMVKFSMLGQNWLMASREVLSAIPPRDIVFSLVEKLKKRSIQIYYLNKNGWSSFFSLINTSPIVKLSIFFNSFSFKKNFCSSELNNFTFCNFNFLNL